MLFGGKYGFLNNILRPLIQSSFINSNAHLGANLAAFIKSFMLTLTIIIFFYAIVIAIIRLLKLKSFDQFIAIIFILVFSISIPILQNIFFDSHLPFKRTALFYLPLLFTTVLFVFEFNDTIKNNIVRKINLVFVIIASLGLIANFSLSANLHKTQSWFFNADVKHMMTDLNKDIKENEQATICVQWIQTKSTEYYKDVRKMNIQISEFGRFDASGVTDIFDYYFLEKHHKKLIKIPEENIQVLKEYPRSGCILLKYVAPKN